MRMLRLSFFLSALNCNKQSGVGVKSEKNGLAYLKRHLISLLYVELLIYQETTTREWFLFIESQRDRMAESCSKITKKTKKQQHNNTIINS